MGLREDIQTDPVSALPLRPPVTCALDDTVRDAVAAMKRAQLGCVFVIDEDRKPIGKFTERLMIQLLATDPSRLDVPIREHMTELQNCVKLDAPIAAVVEAMQTTGVRFVCVVDADGRIANLTGQRSVMEYITEHFPRQIKSQMMEAKLFMDQREGA